MKVEVKSDLISQKEIERAIKKNVEKSVEEISEKIILGQAVRDAPIDTSALRQSGKVSKVETIGNKTTATIGFYTPYAAVQHERADFNHPKGGRPFYLANALKNNINIIKKTLAKNFKKVRF